ncbi:MAG: hypothetical protein IH856_19660 [Deltaproteobacteria bacterium]|nr:hypothetical protein [Deltaproteobacteria bacterium]
MVDSGQFDQLADARDGMYVNVMKYRVPHLNPTVNTMIAVEQPLFTFVFCNDYRTVEIVAFGRSVAAT